MIKIYKIISSLTIVSSVILSPYALADNTIKTNNPDQYILKHELNQQIQNIFPKEICSNIKNLDDYSYSFLKLSSKNKLILCEKQALPIINKNTQKYLSSLPNKIKEDTASKYSVKIYLDSKNQYITNYIKVPKKLTPHFFKKKFIE